MDKNGLKAQIRDQLYAQATQGVQRFTRPGEATEVSVSIQSINSAEIMAQNTSIEALNQAIKSCQNCPLSNQRQKVNFTELPLDSKRYCLIVADFPDALTESENQMFKGAGAFKVLDNLLTKLKLNETTSHRSFAIKCLPKKGIPNTTLSQCSFHLRAEFEVLQPQIVLLFGVRAQESWRMANARKGEAQSTLVPAPECGHWFNEDLNGRPSRIYTLPSARELEAFPEWRMPVWELLREVVDPLV